MHVCKPEGRASAEAMQLVYMSGVMSGCVVVFLYSSTSYCHGKSLF